MEVITAFLHIIRFIACLIVLYSIFIFWKASLTELFKGRFTPGIEEQESSSGLSSG